MAQKAKLFGDWPAFRGIMSTRDPAKQKAIGREVKNFYKEKWESVCREIVFVGNFAKFTQNKILHDELLATGDKKIVEASGDDCIWGIGLWEDDPRIHDEKQWRGTNWLGEAIMQVRAKLISQSIDI